MRLLPCVRVESLRLTAEACRERFDRSRTALPWQSCYLCRSCPRWESQSHQDEKRCCKSCGKIAERMAWQNLCVSCFNRLNELARGRNGRGSARMALHAHCTAHGERLVERAIWSVIIDHGRVCGVTNLCPPVGDVAMARRVRGFLPLLGDISLLSRTYDHKKKRVAGRY